MWNISDISKYVKANGIIIDTKNQTVSLQCINNLDTSYDVEITTEEYDEIVQLLELDNSIGFIQAVSLFTKYTGKTIDEVDFRSL